ncbi:MAG: DEAD/DEAH box helicase [Kiritimatiellaeota bacterium]|nr:DEAD/DEAH box helicase [Kiritimatiellota bacterium]
MLRKLFGKKPKKSERPNHEERENRQKIEVVRKSDAETKNSRPSETKSDEKPRSEKTKTRSSNGNSRRKADDSGSKQSEQRPSGRERNSRKRPGGKSNSAGSGERGAPRRSEADDADHSKEHSPRKPRPVREKKIPPLPDIVEAPPIEGKSRFTDSDLEKVVLAACQDAGFEYCTPIQQKSLPTTLKGLDLTGKAQTGTGKTAVFLISSINRMLRNPLERREPGACRMLVLAPTRELAIQIHKDAEALCKYTNFHNMVVFGGMDHQKQRNELNGPLDILVGTPGRIIDFSRSGALKLNKAEILVIDEADRMLDMGFIPDVSKIVYRLPKAGSRQTMFFSATFDTKILRLVSSWLVDPVSVEVEPENIVSDLINQTFYSITVRDKMRLLLWFLENDDVERMLVFVNRRDTADRVERKLEKAGMRCGLLTGDVPQNKRLKILESFRRGDTKVVVATDVAARGIHVDDVSHVVNYDLPYEPGDYVHRIGRTGRAGNQGKSVSFLCENGAFVMPEIEAILGHDISTVQPTEEMLGK